MTAGHQTSPDVDAGPSRPPARRSSYRRARWRVDTAPDDALVVVDARGWIVLLDGPAEKVFGPGRRARPGQPLATLVPASACAPHATHRARFLAEPRTGETGFGLHLVAWPHDEHEPPAETSVPLIGPAGVRRRSPDRQPDRDAASDEREQLANDPAAGTLRALLTTRRRLRSLVPRTHERVHDELVDMLGEIEDVIRGCTDPALASTQHEGAPVPVPADRSAAEDRRRAAADRQRAAADRRRAAEYLAEAYRDEVTGTLNRRPGRQRIQLEIDRAQRASAPLAVIFLDVDGLKQVNDTHGHARGDALLASTGTALRASLRSYDVIMRYGGDEFVCALPGGTARIASASIRRTRRALADLVPGATLSAGHAQLLPGDTLDDLIRRADMDLYGRRRRGAAR